MKLSLSRFGYVRLGIALLFSALVHFFLFNGLGWHLPISESVSNIQVKLLDPPAEKKVMPRLVPVAKRVAAKVKPKSVPKPEPDLAPKPEPQKTVENTGQVAQQETATIYSENARVADSLPIASKSVEDNQEVLPEVEPEVIAGLTDEELSQLPSRVDMEFDVSRGNNKVGVGHVHFMRNSDGVYRLTSEIEPKGIASLFISGKLIQISDGVVNSRGLKPSMFLYQFGKNNSNVYRADFDWEAGRLTMKSNTERTVVELYDGVQDMLSFMYQFMFVPPLTEMQLSFTNGKKLNRYTYSFEGVETVSTTIGDLNAMHIARSSGEGEEKTELWLNAGNHYLPIKISKIEKDGTVYEQLVTKLEINKQ